MEIYRIDENTSEEMLERIFFTGKPGRPKKYFKTIIDDKEYCVIVHPDVDLSEKFDRIRAKRRQENDKRCYEKNKLERCERERLKYEQTKLGVYVPKQRGRPKKVSQI
jgi:hypothetical protein